LWTAHNEIESKWDFVNAHDLGWTNTTEVLAANELQWNHASGQAEYMNGTIVTRAFVNSASETENLQFTN